MRPTVPVGGPLARVARRGRRVPVVTTALLVAVPGAAGVLARYGLSTAASGDWVLWTTLAINVVGSFLLGLLLAAGRDDAAPGRIVTGVVAT